MLWMYQRVFYGEAGEPMADLNGREWAAVIPLVVMMVWMGVYSQSFLTPVSKATARVLEQTQVNVPFRVGVPEPGTPAWAPAARGKNRSLTVAAQQRLDITEPRASASGVSDLRHGLLGAPPV